MTDEILERTGFVPCEYEPSPEDECEKCDAANVQLYALKTSYWEQEYDTWCGSCVMAWDAELAEDEAHFDALLKSQTPPPPTRSKIKGYL